MVCTVSCIIKDIFGITLIKKRVLKLQTQRFSPESIAVKLPKQRWACHNSQYPFPKYRYTSGRQYRFVLAYLSLHRFKTYTNLIRSTKRVIKPRLALNFFWICHLWRNSISRSTIYLKAIFYLTHFSPLHVRSFTYWLPNTDIQY